MSNKLPLPLQGTNRSSPKSSSIQHLDNRSLVTFGIWYLNHIVLWGYLHGHPGNFLTGESKLPHSTVLLIFHLSACMYSCSQAMRLSLLEGSCLTMKRTVCVTCWLRWSLQTRLTICHSALRVTGIILTMHESYRVVITHSSAVHVIFLTRRCTVSVIYESGWSLQPPWPLVTMPFLLKGSSWTSRRTDCNMNCLLLEHGHNTLFFFYLVLRKITLTIGHCALLITGIILDHEVYTRCALLARMVITNTLTIGHSALFVTGIILDHGAYYVLDVLVITGTWT